LKLITRSLRFALCLFFSPRPSVRRRRRRRVVGVGGRLFDAADDELVAGEARTQNVRRIDADVVDTIVAAIMERDDKLALTLSLILFSATAGWFRRRQKQNEIAVVSNKFIRRTRTIPDDATVGSRGYAALSPPIPYLKSFYKCLEDPCDPTNNPRGYVALCVAGTLLGLLMVSADLGFSNPFLYAENKLVTEMVAQRFLRPDTVAAAFSDPASYSYNSFLGVPAARQAVAYFLARRFLFPDVPLTPEQALQHVSPAHVALGSGCAALLNYTFFILGEENDAVLIPAPYYAAFENDMNVSQV
jgi:hypothetical protein